VDVKRASYFLRESLHIADKDLINSESILQAPVSVTSPLLYVQVRRVSAIATIFIMLIITNN